MNNPEPCICAKCGRAFVKAWTDEEAAEELAENFPGIDVSDCDVVCDDCYKKLTSDAVMTKRQGDAS